MVGLLLFDRDLRISLNFYMYLRGLITFKLDFSVSFSISSLWFLILILVLLLELILLVVLVVLLTVFILLLISGYTSRSSNSTLLEIMFPNIIYCNLLSFV